MATMIWYLLGAIAFFAAVSCFSRYLEGRSIQRELMFEDTPFTALASPSRTNAVVRRIDHAVREASRGFRLCSGCLFTNRANTDTCVLCGFLLVEDSQATAKDDNGSNIPLTRRQRRARTRKDWARDLNEEGAIVWCRTLNDSATSCPSFVLTVVGSESPESAEQVDVDQQPTDHTSDTTNQPLLDSAPSANTTPGAITITIDEPTPPPVQRSLDDVADELAKQTSTLSVDVAEAISGHQLVESSFFTSLCPSTLLSQDANDLVTNSKSDFPTKFAQFVTATSRVFLEAAANEDGTTRSTRLNIDRSQLLPDAVQAIGTFTANQARGPIRVFFSGERGIDAGGVYREFLVLLNEQIVTPSAGIFTCVDENDQTFYLNRHSRHLLGDNHLAHFLVAGRLLGRALLDGNATGFHLCLPLLKILLGLPVSVPDLEFYDAEAFKSLQWLLNHDGADTVGLNFTVTEKLPDGSITTVELVPGGSDIDVTDANKHDFANRKLRYLVFDSVLDQLFAFLKGVYEIVPPNVLALFDAEELDYVLAGSDDIDVDDWERNSQISLNLRLHPSLKNFWKVIRELSVEERRRLLQFATGSTRVPPGGFGALASFDNRQCAFTLHGIPVWKTCGYIRSHACFNRLDLPLHPDIKTMREAVKAAISSDTIGFTAH